MSEWDGVKICRTEMRETVRDPDGERWCFRCRARRGFFYVVMTTVEPSYYDPSPSIRCGTCGGTDADLFPGRNREWA